MYACLRVIESYAGGLFRLQQLLSCLTGQILEARHIESPPFFNLRGVGVRLTTLQFVKSIVMETRQQELGEGKSKGKASAGMLDASDLCGTWSDGSPKVDNEFPWSLEGTPYNAPYGEVPPKKHAMFNLEANENVRISRINYR